MALQASISCYSRQWLLQPLQHGASSLSGNLLLQPLVLLTSGSSVNIWNSCASKPSWVTHWLTLTVNILNLNLSPTSCDPPAITRFVDFWARSNVQTRNPKHGPPWQQFDVMKVASPQGVRYNNTAFLLIIINQLSIFEERYWWLFLMIYIYIIYNVFSIIITIRVSIRPAVPEITYLWMKCLDPPGTSHGNHDHVIPTVCSRHVATW